MTRNMSLNSFIQLLDDNPTVINFPDCIAIIDLNYHFTPCAFSNGQQHNLAGQNNGSCKLFAFGRLQKLSASQILNCFGDYYRIDVLQNPEHTTHQNIREFIRHGWDGVQFESNPLILKKSKL